MICSPDHTRTAHAFTTTPGETVRAWANTISLRRRWTTSFGNNGISSSVSPPAMKAPTPLEPVGLGLKLLLHREARRTALRWEPARTTAQTSAKLTAAVFLLISPCLHSRPIE